MPVQRIERTDLWKSKARVLQLRIRERLRIAVDGRTARLPPVLADRHFSAAVDRWLTRFRHFRRGTLQASSAFHHNRVSTREVNAEEESAVIRMLQSVAVPLLGNMCHVFMNGLNRVHVYGAEKLHDALRNRPNNKPLLTVSNHVASVDDPFVIASILPPGVLLDAQSLRWTLCASDRCFKNPVTSAFFRSVKVLPVARGEGLYQKGMDMALSKLNRGSWVHIFPEGSRSRDGGKTMGSSKRGVGRLVLDADNVPIVIPFVHTGMQEIMPIGANFPRIGKTVTVLVGEPIHFDDLVALEGDTRISRVKLYDAVAARIGNRLHELKAKVEKLALAQAMKLQDFASGSADMVNDELQQIDRDSVGMGSKSFVADDASRYKQREPTYYDYRYKYGTVSRLCSYMDSTKLLGFTARSLIMNSRRKENNSNIAVLNRLKVWRQYLEANLPQGSNLVLANYANY